LGDDQVSVLVCRGCCCGTPRKHPGVDHAAQAATLRSALPAGVPLREVDCLGHCERSNVVVVRSAGQRRWFGEVLDPADTAALAAWVAATTTGHNASADAALPSRLAARQFDPRPTPS
jgi:predicted metal-binding protein